MPSDKRSRKKVSEVIEVTQKTELNFPLSDQKIKEIQACLRKDSLKITVNKVDLTENGRLKGGYEYD